MTGYHMGKSPVRSNSGGVPLFPEDVTVAAVLKKGRLRHRRLRQMGARQPRWDSGGGGEAWFRHVLWLLQPGARPRLLHVPSFPEQRARGAGRTPHAVISNGERIERKGKYAHYAIHEETLKFIRESAKGGKPFFCYAPWTPPHSLLEIPEDDPAWALYKDKPWHGRAKTVAAMMSMVDRHVGEILKLLKELNIDDNTIVFFTSDNGSSRNWEGVLDSSGELKGAKRSMYEGGIRVPMVVRWPGKIKAGTESDLPWYFPDVMPTLAELAGVPTKCRRTSTASPSSPH
jgi:arylsulfatase A